MNNVVYILPFVEITVIACIVAYIFKKSFATVLPSTLFLIVAFMYFFGIIGNLQIGIYSLLIITILTIVYVMIAIIKKDEALIMNVNGILRAPGFVIFIILYLAIFVYNINSSFSFWDEWSHWGMYIKDMILRNRFYNTAGHVATVHLSYPPFIQLFEYWYLKVVGITNMQNMYRANQILCYSLPIMLFSNLEFDKNNNLKNIKTIVIGVLSMLYFILVYRIIDFQANPIKSIYGDAFLAISFGYFMVNVLQFDFDDTFKIFNIILSGIALIFSKQMGTALFLLGIFILFIINFISKNTSKDKYIKGLLIFIIPMFFYISWKVIVVLNGIQDQFDIIRLLNVPELLSILFKGGGAEWQRMVITNFISWLFSARMQGLTFLNWYSLTIILFLIVVYYTKKEYGIKIVVFSIGLLVGFSLYMFALLCLYLYTFGGYEAVRLASIWRYASTYLISLFFVVGYLLLDVMIYKKRMNIKNVLCLVIVLIGLTSSIHFANVVNYAPKSIELSDDYIFNEDFKKMELLPANSKVLIIYQGDQALTGYKFKFKFFDKEFVSCSFGDEIYYDPDIWTKNLTKDEFLDYLKDYDYVYFYKTDENFKLHYGDLFNKDIVDREDVYNIEEIIKK